jgi:hypothetical protein
VNALSEFLRWASNEQSVRADSRFAVSLSLGPPTKKRSAHLSIEEFEIEPTGWVTRNLVRGGTLSVWETGEADAVVETAETLRDQSGPEYSEHWDEADISRSADIFARFLQYFDADSRRAVADA